MRRGGKANSSGQGDPAMLEFDPEKVLLNARGATNEDLLNRVTVFRNQMEPEAVDIIERELRSRGVTAADQLAHADRFKDGVIVRTDGTVARCSVCRQPAIAQRWSWHWLWGKVPLFPVRVHYCRQHLVTS
jgi:hypothetical protein